MNNLETYISKYADTSFDDMPFGEIDALIFSQLSYIDFSGIVGSFDSDIEVTLREASNEYFSLYNDKTLKEKISIVYKAGLLLKSSADTKRYKDIKLLRYVNNVNDRIDKQFSAVTFYINDSLAVISYRGTDTSITGIKESAMLSYMFPVPAQIHGLYYLQESGTLAKRSLIVCGHSKGGNLATFSAVSCSNSLKKSIIGIYEFDAPGFTEEFIERSDYAFMANRIYSYIPESSIIGCMLYHSTTRRVVKSTNESIRQHQVSSWQIEDSTFIFADETDALSRFIDKYLKELTQSVGADKIEDLFETIFDFIEDTGINEYEDFKKFNIVRFIAAVNSVKSLTADEKELIEGTIRQAIKELSTLFYKERLSMLGINI